MATFHVYEPPHHQPGSFEAADRSVFIKDGFSWGAILVAPLWLLWRQMWFVFLAWLGFTVLTTAAIAFFKLPEGVGAAINIGSGLWLAVEGNALRRWTLARRGWRFVGLSTGVDETDAEARFFMRRGVGPRSQVSPGPRSLPSRPGVAISGTEPVIGVFPEPALPGRGTS